MTGSVERAMRSFTTAVLVALVAISSESVLARGESLNDIPAAVSVISGDDLANFGTQSAESLIASLPANVNVDKTFGRAAEKNDVYVRGLGLTPEGAQLVGVDGIRIDEFSSFLNRRREVIYHEPNLCRRYLGELSLDQFNRLLTPQRPNVGDFLEGYSPPWSGAGLIQNVQPSGAVAYSVESALTAAVGEVATGDATEEVIWEQFDAVQCVTHRELVTYGPTRTRTGGGSTTGGTTTGGGTTVTKTPPPIESTPPPTEYDDDGMACSEPTRSALPTPAIKVKLANPALAEFPYPRPLPLQLLIRDFDTVKVVCDGCGGGLSDITRPIEDGIKFGQIKWELTTKGSLNKPYLDTYDLDALQREIDRLNSEIEALSKEIEALKRLKEQLDASRADRKAKLEKEIQELEALRQQALADKERIQSELSRLDSEISRLQQEIEARRKLIEEKQAEIERRLKEIDELNRKIAGEPSDAARDLAAQIEALEKELEKLRNQYQQMRQDHAAAEQALLDAVNAAEQALDQAILNRDQLAAQAAALQAQIRALEGQLFATPLMREIIDARGRIAQLSRQLAGEIPNVTAPTSVFSKLEQLLTAPASAREQLLQAMMTEGGDYVQSLRNACNSATCDGIVDQMEDQFDALNDALNRAIANPNQLIDPNVWAQLQARRAQLAALLPNLQAAEQAVIQAQMALNQARQTYLQTLKQFEQQELALLNQIKALEQQIAELNMQLAAQLRADAIERELNTPKWKAEIAEHQAAIDKLYAEINSLRIELESLERELHDNEAKRIRLLQELKRLEELIADLTRIIAEKRQELADIDNENADIDRQIADKEAQIEAKQTELEDLLARASGQTDGNKKAFGQQNWFIPPPLEKILKDPGEFDRLKRDIGTREKELAEAKGAKKALQEEAYKIIKDVTAALWEYKAANDKIGPLTQEISDLQGEKTRKQADNAIQGQQKLRDAQAKKAEIEGDLAEAEQKAEQAKSEAENKKGLLDDAEAKVKSDEEAVKAAQEEATAMRSQREFQERNRQAKQRTVAEKRVSHSDLVNKIREQESDLAAIERNRAREDAAGNTQGAANLAEAADFARNELKKLRQQLDTSRPELSQAEANLALATSAEQQAVDQELAALEVLTEAEASLRESRARLKQLTKVHEAAEKRAQEAQRAADELKNKIKKAEAEIDEINKEIAKSDETEELDKQIKDKEKAKQDATNAKNAALEKYSRLVERRNKFYEDKAKADDKISAAKGALDAAKQALRTFLDQELTKIDLQATINITDIDDTVADQWRSDDVPRNAVLKIQYSGRNIQQVVLEGEDPDLNPPPKTEKLTVCNPTLGFDAPAPIIPAGDKPQHFSQEPETVMLWYQKGKPLYDVWPPITRDIQPPLTDPIPTGTTTTHAANAGGGAADAGAGAAGPDDDGEEEVDKRRIMRAADWWKHGGEDNDRALMVCKPGGGTAYAVGGFSGGGEGLTTTGPQCGPGPEVGDSLADITRTGWKGAQPYTSPTEDSWMMKVPEVPGDQCEYKSDIKVEVVDSGLQASDDPKKGSDQYEHIAGLIGDKSKKVREFDKNHKTELKIQLYDGQHKGLEGETIEWRVTGADGGKEFDDSKYGLTAGRAKELLDEKTDGSGYSKVDFYLEADYGKASIEVKWKRKNTVCKTVNIDVLRPLELRKLDMGFAPKDGWEQGEEFFKDGTGIDPLAAKLDGKTDSVVVLGVGLINDRYDPFDDGGIEFSVMEPPDGVKLDPETMKTRTYGLAWSRVVESPEEAELKLKAKVEGVLNPYTEPPEIEAEQSTKTIKRFRIGPKDKYLTVETEEGFVPGGEPWSGKGKLILTDDSEIPKDFEDLVLKVVSLEVDPNSGEEPIATAGEVLWPESDSESAWGFDKKGFKFELKKLGLTAGSDGRVEGTVQVRTGVEESDTKSVNFSATVGPDGFYGALTDMPEIELAGMKLEKGAHIELDLHRNKDPDPVPEFGGGKTWTSVTNGTRQGLLIRTASIVLPEALKGANDTPPKLSAKDLLIASAGVSGEVTLQHTISAGLGKLNFSINEVALRLVQNQPTGTTIKGALKMPEPYVGEILGEVVVATGNEYSFSAKTETPVSAPQLGMVFAIQLLEGKYAQEKFSFEIKNAIVKSENFSDFTINKFKFDSDGNLDAKIPFDDLALKFAGGFDIQLRLLEFTKNGSDYRVAVESGFTFATLTAEKVNFAIVNGPTIESLEIVVDYNRPPVTVGGSITYKQGLFEGRVDVDAKAISMNALFLMGSHKEPDNSTWTFWYVELNSRTAIPLGNSGLSIIELGGGVGYNYDPPIGSLAGAARKTDTLSLKASLGIGDAPTKGSVFAGRTQLVLVSGRFSINGKVWVLDREQAIYGEGQLNFHWAPSEKVDGYVRMGLGIPDQAGKIVAFNGDVGFRFEGLSDWEIKSRSLNGSVLERVIAKGNLEIKPGKVLMEGDLSYDVYKEVGISEITLKAQVDLDAGAKLEILVSSSSSSIDTSAAFNGLMNLKLDTPVREFELAASRVSSNLRFRATQSGGSFSGSISGQATASWSVWGYEGSREVDIGYTF